MTVVDYVDIMLYLTRYVKCHCTYSCGEKATLPSYIIQVEVLQGPRRVNGRVSRGEYPPLRIKKSNVLQKGACYLICLVCYLGDTLLDI